MIKRSVCLLTVLMMLVILIISGCSSSSDKGWDDPSKNSTTGNSWSSSALETSNSSGTSFTPGGDVKFSNSDLASAGDDSGQLIGEKTKKMLDDAEDDANLMNGFIIGQANNLFKIPGINSIQNLIFGNPYETWGFGKENKNDKFLAGIFYESTLNEVINPLIATVSGVYATVLMLAIMMSTLKLGMKAHSPQSKEDFWKDVHMYVASAFFMALFWMLFNALMAINSGLIQGVAGTLKSLDKPLDGASIIATATNDESYKFAMGDLFVFLAEWGLAAYLNFIYIARQLIIILLCVLSPVAAYSLLFARTRSFFGTYMKELVGNIFLPSIHAMIMFVFVQLAGNLGQGMGPTIFKLGMIIMFVPITGMVSKWLNLGDSSTAMGRTATALGLGALGGAAMLSKGAMNMSGRGRASTNQMSGNGGVGTETPSGNGVSMGNDSGASVLTKAAAGGQGWGRIKKAGAMTGAVLGGTVGLPFGAGGVAAGAAIGSKTISGLMQGTRNTLHGLGGVGTTLYKTGKGLDSNGKPNWSFGNIKEKWGDLAERRQLMGNLGEASGLVAGGVGAAIGTAVAGPIGTALGGTLGTKLGTSGKTLGQMLSGVSRQSAFEHGKGLVRPDGTISPRGLTPDQLATEPRFLGGPNGMGEVRWNQTNERSWYEAKDQNTGSWERIGGIGAGDSSLNGSQRRMVDYNLRHPGDQWTRQENGSYTRTNETPEATNNHGRYQEKARTEREIVGMSGSTASLGRKSEAYFADSTGKKLYSDNSFDMRKLNPEDYFNHSQLGQVDQKGKPTAGDDKVANFMSGTYRTGSSIGKASYNTAASAPRKVGGWVQQGLQNYKDRKSDVV